MDDQVYLCSNSAEYNKGYMTQKGNVKIEDFIKDK